MDQSPDRSQVPPARIAVVGSINTDLVAVVERLPRPGETVSAKEFATHPGGKGGNQALAARRLGAEVTLIGRVGADPGAEAALVLLRRAGVDLASVVVDAYAPTGTAMITVDAAGENQIVVVPGANHGLRPGDLGALDFDAVICQLEVPLHVVEAAARSAGGFFCLNPTPVIQLPPELVENCDLIVVNDVEWEALSALLTESHGLVAITHGSQGATLLRNGIPLARAWPPVVAAIDTIGAGDAFVAGLVTGLISGMSEPEALAWACAVGALATTKHGAQPAFPDRASVDALLKDSNT